MKVRAISQLGFLLREQGITLWDAFVYLLWPSQCRVCQSIIENDESYLCRSCWQKLSVSIGGHYCLRCGRTISPYGVLPTGCGHCQQEAIAFDGILRVGQYESVLRQLILQLKFHEVTEWTNFWAPLLRIVFKTQAFMKQIDCLVPVPLHWRRRLERGFNQSFLLARCLGSAQNPVCQDLVRIRNTRRQWDLTPAQRRRNVRGAFAIRRDHSFSGKTICLVDDITTSGATLNECARTLKKAGAKHVYAIVLAVAESIE